MMFSRELCDRAAVYASTQPDADLMIRMLGLVEQPGNNSGGRSGRGPRPTMRPPLWMEQAVGSLSNVSRAGDGLND